jgi:hypothetical protein
MANDMNYPDRQQGCLDKIKPEIAGNKTIFVEPPIWQDDSRQQLHQRSARSHGQRLQRVQERQISDPAALKTRAVCTWYEQPIFFWMINEQESTMAWLDAIPEGFLVTEKLVKRFDEALAVDEVSLSIGRARFLPCWAVRAAASQPCCACWRVSRNRRRAGFCWVGRMWQLPPTTGRST